LSQGAVGKEWVGVMAKPVVFFGALFGPAPWCPLGSGSLSAPVGSGCFGALVVLVPWVPLRVPLLLALRGFRPLGVRWVPVPCAPLSVASHSAAEEALLCFTRPPGHTLAVACASAPQRHRVPCSGRTDTVPSDTLAVACPARLSEGLLLLPGRRRLALRL
jgi:hypothetical protein